MDDIESVQDIAEGSKSAACKLFLQRIKDVNNTVRAATEVCHRAWEAGCSLACVMQRICIFVPTCLQGATDGASVLRQVNVLFSGTFSSVVEPLLKDDPGCRVVRVMLKSGVGAVVKVISNADPGDKVRATREIKLLRMFSDLNSQHICGIKDSAVTTTCSAMMLEYMELGTVRDFLQNAPPEHTVTDPKVEGGATRLRLKALLHLCTDVLAGLAVMHAHGVCHRDIKPANIGATAMSTLGRVGYKIIDLGIAVGEIAKEGMPPSLPSASSSSTAPGTANMMTGLMTGMMELKNLRGTPLFMSPEQLDENQSVSEAQNTTPPPSHPFR